MEVLKVHSALLVLVLCARCVSGSYPKAQNVTWKSTNFKTFLTWEPKPSDEFTYTVEYSAIGRDIQRNPHCIRSSQTLCDLTLSLTDLNSCYSADVLSQPPLGAASDLIEFPHTTSPRFCPYKDTDIGKPEFKLKVSEDKRKTTLYVSDPLTALFKDGRQQTIRDIFADELKYKVTYRRNKSTGKKVFTSDTNEIELTNLDRGESYCFNVQAYIPTRSVDKQLGEMSQTQCSEEDNPPFFKVYSIRVILVTIVIVLLVVGVIIGVIVFCCKRRKQALRKGRDAVPLQDV